MCGYTLDPLHKIFISENCLQDENFNKRVKIVLEKYKFPKEKIIDGIDLDIAYNGDYLIRCIGDTIQVFVLEFLINFGFQAKRIGDLDL